MMTRGKFCGAAAAVATVVVGCTGGGDTPTTPSTSDDAGIDAGTVIDAMTGLEASVDAHASTMATPQAIFEGRVQTAAGKDCRDSGELFDVGVFGNASASPPTASEPIPDGASSGQGTASVRCTVSPATMGTFTVTAEVDLTGATGGTFRLDGALNASGDSTSIHVVASTERSANRYEETGCTVRFATTGQGVAAGRVWAVFSCPSAVNQGDNARACDLEGEFRFENCTQ